MFTNQNPDQSAQEASEMDNRMAAWQTNVDQTGG